MTTFTGDWGSAERVSAYFRDRYRAHDQCGTLELNNPHAAKNAYAALFLGLNDSAGQPTNASLAVEALHLSASECRTVDLGFDFSPFYSVPPLNPPVCHLVMGADFGPVNQKYALSSLYGTPRLYLVTGDAPDKNPQGFYAKLALFASKLRAAETWNRTKVYVLASHFTGVANEKLGPGYESFTTYSVPMKGAPGTAKGQREEIVNLSLHSSFKPRVFWKDHSAFPADGRGKTPCIEGNELIKSTPEIGSSLSAEEIAEVFGNKSTLNVYIYRISVPQILGMGPHVWGASHMLWILTNHLRETEYFPFGEELLQDIQSVEALYQMTYQMSAGSHALTTWQTNRIQAAEEYPQVEELPIDVDVVQGIIWDFELATRVAIEFEAYGEIAYRTSTFSKDPNAQWYEATRNPNIQVDIKNAAEDEASASENMEQEMNSQQMVQELAEGAECTVVFGVYPGLVDYRRGPKDSRWTNCQPLRTVALMAPEERSFRVDQMNKALYESDEALEMRIRHMLLPGEEGVTPDHHLVLVYGQVPDIQRDEALNSLLTQLSAYNPKVIILETGALDYDERYEQTPCSTATYRTDGKLYEQPIPLSEHYRRCVECEPGAAYDVSHPAKFQSGTFDHEVAELTENLAFTIHYEWGLPVTVLRVGYALPYLYKTEGTMLISQAVLRSLEEQLPTPIFGSREREVIDAMVLDQYRAFEEKMETDPDGREALTKARRGVLPWGV